MRADEFTGDAWSDEAREQILRMQFTVREAAYRTHYPGAQHQVVVADGQPVGRLLVCALPAAIYVADIALLTAWRGRGIGSRLLRDVLAEGERMNKPVRLQVVQDNARAIGLYDRLGFRTRSQAEPYLEMEWRPPSDHEPT